MTKDKFLEAAQKWIDAGAGCGRLQGTITQVEKFASSYAFNGPQGRTTVLEDAARTVNIRRYSDGTVSATATMGGRQTMTTVANASGCQVTYVVTTMWNSTTSNPMEPEALTITRNGGAYEISFTLPEEKTQTTHQMRVSAPCPIPDLNSGPETDDELVWPPWHFEIHCPPNFTPDAQNTIDCDVNTSTTPPVLSGKIVRTVIGASDATERQSWLNESPVGTSRADDGTPISLMVETTWNLRADR
jgi:hypothetical protein